MPVCGGSWVLLSARRGPAFIAGQAIETIMGGGDGGRIRGLRKGFPYFSLSRRLAFLLDACVFIVGRAVVVDCWVFVFASAYVG
jgi:hypothetical protein